MVLTFLVAVILSVLSTGVMGYIGMAIPIGPWIAPTLALFAIIIFKIFSRLASNNSKEIALATSAGSVGGIIATAIGFYFTTLYFLDPNLFNSWMKSLAYFIFVLAFLSLTAGMFGIWVANMFENKFIITDKLAFPIGELVHKTIAAYRETRKSIELAIGFVGTGIFCFLQDGAGTFTGIIPTSLTLVNYFTISIFKIPAIRLDLWPMLWALGFVTGHVVALPLSVGVLSKVLLVRPLYTFAFQDFSWMEFIITFCSGMVLSTAVFGLISTPKSLWLSCKGLFKKGAKSTEKRPSFIKNVNVVETVILVVLFVGFMTYFKFSILSQMYLFIFAFICTYQIAIIAGKIGLAPMGKFATFVMVPAMFIFPINYVQIVLISTFVGICGGVAADILFGRKLAHLSDISSSRIKAYQYLGLIISSLCTGVVFWFLIKNFNLGSDQLFALRAQNRWLLINTLKNAKSLNYYILIVGFVFGFILSKIRVSPLLVLGGLFMPVNITLGLVIGATGAMFVKKRQEWYPFWSGVYASNSIWILVKSIL